MNIEQAVRRVRRSDPGTSFESAVKAEAFAGDHAERVLEALRAAARPVGAEEVADIAGLQPYQVRKRLPELKTAGLAVLAPGERKTRCGRTERLWHIPEGAKQ